MNHMKILRNRSSVGSWLAGIYVLASLACIAVGLLPGGDPKGRFVFLQFPIAVQGGLAQELGFAPYMENLSWVGAYALFGLPTVVLLYLVGYALQRPK